MYVILAIVTVVLTHPASGGELTQEEAQTFLRFHGYFHNNESADVQNLESLADGLSEFQAIYNLPEDGTLNPQTVSFIQRYWCGTSDNYYTLHNSKQGKWNTNILKWTVYPPSTAYLPHRQKYVGITRQAFEMWSANSNLQFEYVNPYSKKNISVNIVISFTEANHTFRRINNRDWCPFPTGGMILGHAYFPDLMSTTEEVHIQKSLSWYLDEEPVPEGATSLLRVLTHEIGHVLGIAHSANYESIMYPSLVFENTTKLSQDDILAIQELYGSKPVVTTARTTVRTMKTTKTMPTTTTKTTTTIPTPNTQGINLKVPKLCDLNSKMSNTSFLIVNNKLYLFYKKYVWMLNLNTREIQDTPLVITDWLTFLHTPFEKISGIYQKPDNEIVLFSESMVYIFEYASFRLLKREHYNVLMQNYPAIRGVVNSYRGKTYWFFDNNMFSEIDDCRFLPKSTALITEQFTGVPSKIDSVFRSFYCKPLSCSHRSHHQIVMDKSSVLEPIINVALNISENLAEKQIIFQSTNKEKKKIQMSYEGFSTFLDFVDENVNSGWCDKSIEIDGHLNITYAFEEEVKVLIIQDRKWKTYIDWEDEYERNVEHKYTVK
ncbi:neutrophil collagenase-like [Sitophilus oryzae]|uniref:Neutrophil collagenase-like n=2 Tax=Sitophilus oryzae TaxID=7048 RepID=A0A6J2XIJ1_SITOR|nr:neutrophil collagenase-like [Sitophilus oryzae]